MKFPHHHNRRDNAPLRIPSDQYVLAYIAGLFDGEGSINITKRKSRSSFNPSHGLVVQIDNTDHWVIAWLQALMGGSVHVRHLRKLQYKDGYTWAACSRQAVPFLEAILPYLIIKKARAEIAISFQRLSPKSFSGPVRLNDDLLAQREEKRRQLMVLNKKGAA